MKISKELLKGTTPIMVLKTISEKETYGYEIVQSLYRNSNDFFKLNEGTLYPILHSLENEGYLSSYMKKSEIGRERKYYRITTSGKMYLAMQIEEWNLFSNTVQRVLNGG